MKLTRYEKERELLLLSLDKVIERIEYKVTKLKEEKETELLAQLLHAYSIKAYLLKWHLFVYQQLKCENLYQIQYYQILEYKYYVHMHYFDKFLKSCISCYIHKLK